MIVFAVIIAVIAAILFIPIKIVISFRGRLELWVRVLFLRFKILPKKKEPEISEPEKRKSPEKPKVKEEEPEKEAEKPARPEKGPIKQKSPKQESPKQESPAQADEKVEEEEASFIDRFLHYYSIAAQFLDPVRRALRRLIRIDELNVNVRVGTLDAADTAVYTGMTWGIAGNLLALAARFVTFKKRNITVEPAYNQSVLSAEGDCIIHTNAANIIGAAAIVAYAYWKYRLNNRRNKK